MANSNISTITCGAPQGSVLGPLLCLIYINDLNLAIKHLKAQHFADDTNLLNINKSPKRRNKRTNIDLKNLRKWLNANNKIFKCLKNRNGSIQTKKKKYGHQS